MAGKRSVSTLETPGDLISCPQLEAVHAFRRNCQCLIDIVLVSGETQVHTGPCRNTTTTRAHGSLLRWSASVERSWRDPLVLKLTVKLSPAYYYYELLLSVPT